MEEGRTGARRAHTGDSKGPRVPPVLLWHQISPLADCCWPPARWDPASTGLEVSAWGTIPTPYPPHQPRSPGSVAASALRAPYLVFPSRNGLGSLRGKGECNAAPGYGEGRDGAAPASPGMSYPLWDGSPGSGGLWGWGGCLVQAVLCAGSDVLFLPQLPPLCPLLAAQQQFFSGKLYVLL